MGGFASSVSGDSNSGSNSDSGTTSNEWWRGGSEDEKWIEVRGKKTNKDNTIKSTLNSLKHVTPNKYTTLSTYIEDTPSPPEQFHNNDRTQAAQKQVKKQPTQKHVRHTLWLLVQQESAFLDRSITRAENETTELTKRDKTNKQWISIDKNHQLPHHQLEWKQKAKNAAHNITGSIYRAFKSAKTAFTKTKTVSFAMTQQVPRPR